MDINLLKEEILSLVNEGFDLEQEADLGFIEEGGFGLLEGDLDLLDVGLLEDFYPVKEVDLELLSDITLPDLNI